MIFSRGNHARGALFLSLFLFAFWILWLGGAHKAAAQITIAPEADEPFDESGQMPASRPAAPNEYAAKYKEAPRLPAGSTAWFSSPNDIASRISLDETSLRVQYDAEGAAYLEARVDDERGRAFLKETSGSGYRIYDFRFAPYGAAEDGTRVVPAGYGGAQSFLVDIIKFNGAGQTTSTTRYRGDAQVFQERYNYTNRGALRMLTRTYADGSLLRFLYFFAGGGLEEEFRQNADGSTHSKKYAPDGSLKTEEAIDQNGAVTYRLALSTAKDGTLLSREEVRADQTPATREITRFENGRAANKTIYRIDTPLAASQNSAQKKDTEKDQAAEAIIASVDYRYDEKGNLLSDTETGLLRQTDRQFERNEAGAVTLERVFEDGVLKKEIAYGENNVRVETQFFNGKPALRVQYRGAQKEKEESLQ